MVFLLTFDTEEEKEKFSVIYEDYAEFMLRVARRYLPIAADAEDVLHDTFLYLADNLGKINLSDRVKTRAYLAIITKHKAIDHIRQMANEVPLTDREADLMADSEWSEEESLTEAMLHLSREYREILLLHYYHGYSYHEIAALFGESYRAITGKASRAKQKLAKILTETE